MKSNDQTSQRLIDALALLDENTLFAAHSIDTPEKFRALGSARVTQAKPDRPAGYARRYLAAAACLAIALAIALSAFFFWRPQTPPIYATQLPNTTESTSPTAVIIPNPTTTRDPTAPTTVPVPEILGGKCGENVSFTFNYDSRVLTIYGVGPMEDYTNDQQAPWHTFRDQVSHLIVEEGVTTIGSHAFGSTGLRNVQLPSSLEIIGNEAFANCCHLYDINLPDSITVIGDSAFEACSSLKSVQLPASLLRVSYGLFQKCSELQGVTLPQSLQSIETNAFSGCTSLRKITIPDSVKTIGGSAFADCTNLYIVEFGAGLQEINSYAFSGCTALQDITLPDSLTTIGTGAFAACTELHYVSIGAGVSSIGTDAFKECYALTYFKIYQNNPYYAVDAQGVLYNKDKTQLILMPPGFQGEYTVLPGTVSIGDSACHSVYGLTAIHFPDSLQVIGDRAFVDCEYLEEVYLPEGLVEIYSFAFSSCFRLKKVTIPASVKTILAAAFSECEHLEIVIFLGSRPITVNAPFSGCRATVYYPAGDASWDPLPTRWGDGLTFVAE